MTNATLNEWLDDSAWDRIYWSEVREVAQSLDSDGCSGVPNWFVWTCWEHDTHYRLHRMLDGTIIDKRTADYILRVRIQQSSGFYGVRFLGHSLQYLSIVSWIRWLAVTWSPTARRAWDRWNEDVKYPPFPQPVDEEPKEETE